VRVQNHSKKEHHNILIISQILFHIKKYENKEVARHFRSNKHKITDFKICVFKTDIENDEIRKNIE
jgi:hypothetical protein